MTRKERWEKISEKLRELEFKTDYLELLLKN